MVLASEIFPKVNPLTNIVESFSNLWETENYTREDAMFSILHWFSQAGVETESVADQTKLIKLLLEFEILEFIRIKDEPALVLHSKFRGE